MQRRSKKRGCEVVKEGEAEGGRNTTQPPLPAWVEAAGQYYFHPPGFDKEGNFEEPAAGAGVSAAPSDETGLLSLYMPSAEPRLLPVRCFNCNKILGNKSSTYDAIFLRKHVQEGLPRGAARLATFEEMRIKRDCCRNIFLTWVDHTVFAGHKQPTLRNTTWKQAAKDLKRVICITDMTRKRWRPPTETMGRREAYLADMSMHAAKRDTGEALRDEALAGSPQAAAPS